MKRKLKIGIIGAGNIGGALHRVEGGRKYVQGLFRLGQMQLYVNRGIGTVGLPFRLNCPPEITLFTLQQG